jgi:hypothetical protein
MIGGIDGRHTSILPFLIDEVLIFGGKVNESYISFYNKIFKFFPSTVADAFRRYHFFMCHSDKLFRD